MNTINFGLNRFHKVDDNIYRSALPKTDKDFRLLKEHGITTTIHLGTTRRTKAKVINEYKLKAQKFGITPHIIHLKRGLPDENTLQKIFEVLKGSSLDNSCLIHCRKGLDRTGIVVALHRVINNKWSKLKAWQEMKKIGHKPLICPQYKKFLSRIKI